MFAILAAIAAGIGFILELLNQSQRYVWLALLAAVFFVALQLVSGAPVIARRRQ